MLSWRTTIQAVFSLTLMAWAIPVSSGSNGIHIMIEFQGNVRVKKAQWKDFHQAKYGITLSGEDKIELRGNASVRIYCSNQNQWTVKQPGTYLVSEGCPEGEPVIKSCPDCNNDKLRPFGTKEEKLKQLPYLISPRHTLVFNESLTFRWNEVPGAREYTVRVGDWERKTQETQIVYDGELEPGKFYDVRVVADNKMASTDEDDGQYSWFIVLEEEEAKTLEERVGAIERLENPEGEGLVLAYFYRGNELNAEAIQVLEGLIESGSQTTTVYQLLGDIYRQVGLSLMAKEVYQQGLALTVEEEMSEVKAMMQWGLGVVEYLLGNRDEAAEWLEKARVNYLALGKQLNKEEEKLINQILGGN